MNPKKCLGIPRYMYTVSRTYQTSYKIIQTIQNIQKWLNDILSVCGNLPVIIVGNKMDRKDNVQSLDLVKFRDARLVSMYNGNKNIKNILISVKANTCLQRGRHGDTICENGIIIPIEELLSMYYNVDVKIEL